MITVTVVSDGKDERWKTETVANNIHAMLVDDAYLKVIKSRSDSKHQMSDGDCMDLDDVKIQIKVP